MAISMSAPLTSAAGASGLPELPASSRVVPSSQSKHAARLVALQLWLPAVLHALGTGALCVHSPLSLLLELHVPFVVALQARARGLLTRQYLSCHHSSPTAR